MILDWSSNIVIDDDGKSRPMPPLYSGVVTCVDSETGEEVRCITRYDTKTGFLRRYEADAGGSVVVKPDGNLSEIFEYRKLIITRSKAMESQQQIPESDRHSFIGAQPQQGMSGPEELPAKDQQRLSIRHCYSCHGSHENLAVKEYGMEREPFSHWYLCPTTGDPVSLQMRQVNGKATEVTKSVIDAIERAMLTGHYMVAVFRNDGRIHLDRFCHEFMTGDFDVAVETLKKNLDRERGIPNGPPLAKASLPAKLSIFGQALAAGATAGPETKQVIQVGRQQEQPTTAPASSDADPDSEDANA